MMNIEVYCLLNYALVLIAVKGLRYVNNLLHVISAILVVILDETLKFHFTITNQRMKGQMQCKRQMVRRASVY